jgi:hypothetical protein
MGQILHGSATTTEAVEPLIPPARRGGNRRHVDDMRPFPVGQIARIAKPTAVVASAIFVGLHRRPPK